MNEMKHTKGPWHYCGHERGGCECRMVWSHPADAHVATAQHHNVVACVHHEWGDGADMIYGGFSPGETLANTRLIALSPELLQIAIRLQEWDKKWPKYHDRSGESEKEMDAICRDAATLVTKATQQP
jgi:hypothetical protein